jgi:hypothetical protein
LVSEPQIEKSAKNVDFLGRIITKNWRNTPKIAKNSWFSIRVWAAKVGHPWFRNTCIKSKNFGFHIFEILSFRYFETFEILLQCRDIKLVTVKLTKNLHWIFHALLSSLGLNKSFF